MIYLLDTDHNSALQDEGTYNRNLLARLRQIGPDDYGTTIVSYEEQVRGRLAQVASAKTARQEVDARNLLYINLQFYASLSVWQYTSEAAARFEELRRSIKGVGTNDLKIAAIALSTGATLLTRNRQHFEKVPGLLFEDWTQESR